MTRGPSVDEAARASGVRRASDRSRAARAKGRSCPTHVRTRDLMEDEGKKDGDGTSVRTAGAAIRPGEPELDEPEPEDPATERAAFKIQSQKRIDRPCRQCCATVIPGSCFYYARSFACPCPVEDRHDPSSRGQQLKDVSYLLNLRSGSAFLPSAASFAREDPFGTCLA